MFDAQHRDALLLIGTTVFLTGLGLVMVLSASSVTGQAANGDPFGRVGRQALFAAVGIPLMLVCGRMPVSFWKRWAVPLLFVAAGLQFLVFIPGIGTGNGYNTNWITIAGFSAQPSEFVKIALIVWIGALAARRAADIGVAKRVLLPVALVSAVAIGLVLVGNDLGTAAIMLLIVFACVFFAGAKLWHLGVGVVVIGLGVAVLALTGSSRSGRISAWLSGYTDPTSYALYGWQPTQGYFALANGGIFGAGLGNSRAKWAWLPESDSDYIFAIIGEELGLIGAVVVIGLFVVLAVTMFRIIRRSEDPFARVVTGGVLVWVTGQAFVNIAVVLGLLPVLGVPLPLISAGGSSLLAILIALGIVLSFARAERKQRLS